jgi:hypothetical protein
MVQSLRKKSGKLEKPCGSLSEQNCHQEMLIKTKVLLT